jgi:hypothetical protein
MLAQYVVMRQAVAAGQRTRKDDQRSISRGDKQDIANAKTGKHAWSITAAPARVSFSSGPTSCSSSLSIETRKELALERDEVVVHSLFLCQVHEPTMLERNE